ncbi:MAG: HlyD family secretion protein [Perlucidibaca sp.]
MPREKLVRFLLTAAVFLIAALLGHALWLHYMHAPWTRDGRIKADIINVAPDISGLVTEVAVHDNQFVHAGDVLFRIDPARYQLALRQADATLAARRTELGLRRDEAARRASLAGAVVSQESRSTAQGEAAGAGSRLDEALAARELAQLNLVRTEVRAAVDGYVANLNVHGGDYVTAGKPVLALVDSHSFWAYGYFEETKLPLIRVGDPATVRLMSSGEELKGHVDSLSRGITDRENSTGRELLADVNPTFSWVRLAQRVPVRIKLDEQPRDVLLTAGMTCTVIVHPRDRDDGEKR